LTTAGRGQSDLQTAAASLAAPLATPAITVAIPTRNRGALIEETLRALLSLDYPELEILIIDQSTDSETRRCVEDLAAGNPRVHFTATTTVGSSAGRNLGARLSHGEVIAYTDDDCVVSKGWLNALAAEFRNPRVSAVYGRLLPWESADRTGLEVGFKSATERAEYSRRTPPWYIGHGGNMAFRRRDLLEAGGFDPLLGAGGFFGACEDPDIAYRLLAAGKTIVYCPNALAFHKHWKDWRAQRQMERAYGVGAGAQFAKYIRCGDLYGFQLLATWIWQLGVRRVGSGLLKWRNLKTVYLGYCQLVYPWVGIWRSLWQPVDDSLLTYVER
jgi:GT2 family glycosyltransferase